LWIWDARTLVVRHTQAPVYGRPFFSADGKTMAIGGAPDVLVYGLSGEVPRLAQRRAVPSFDGSHGVALLPDGRSVAVGDGAGSVAVYDLEAADVKPRMILRERAGGASDNLMVSPNGKQLGAICREPAEAGKPYKFHIRFWDISGAKPRELFSLPFTVNGELSALLSPDGKTLFLAGAADQWLAAYDLTGIEPKLLDRIQTDAIFGGEYQATAFNQGAGAFGLLRQYRTGLELWQLADGKLKKAKEFPKNTEACSDDLSRLIVSSSRELIGTGGTREISLCDVTGKKLVAGVAPVVVTHDGRGLPFVAGGRVFTTADPFQLWEVKDGAWTVVQQNHKDWRQAFHGRAQTISPNEKLVAAALDEGIRVARVEDLFPMQGDEVWPTIPSRNGSLIQFCWGADSKTLFTTQADGTTQAWDVTQLALRPRLVWKGSSPSLLLTASSDGRRLACINEQRKLFVLDMVGKDAPSEVPVPEPGPGFYHARFTMDGAALLAAHSGGKLFRYTLDQLQAKPTVVVETPQPPDWRFELSRDGKFLVSSDWSTLRWYDATTTPMGQLGEWKQFAPSMYFQIAPDSRHVLLEQAGMIYVLRLAGSSDGARH
jgi:WD40 repeat protein